MLIRIIAIRLEIHPPNGTTTVTQLHTHTDTQTYSYTVPQKGLLLSIQLFCLRNVALYCSFNVWPVKRYLYHGKQMFFCVHLRKYSSVNVCGWQRSRQIYSRGRLRKEVNHRAPVAEQTASGEKSLPPVFIQHPASSPFPHLSSCPHLTLGPLCFPFLYRLPFHFALPVPQDMPGDIKQMQSV